MISHKYKVIFIHIPKCAGTTVESSFGITPGVYKNKMLYGWNNDLKYHMQHMTPKQLLENNLITLEQWESYYKFTIVRNPYDRAYSDYYWFKDNSTEELGEFRDYINFIGKFNELHGNEKIDSYRGDHLYKQVDYLFIDDKPIQYDTIIRFESIGQGFNKVIKDLNLKEDFFNRWEMPGKSKPYGYNYRLFYDRKKMDMVYNKFKNDLDYLNYKF